MHIEENGKTYRIENGRVVTASTTPEPGEVKEFKVQDRVEAEGKLGHIIIKSPSVYGTAYTVSFDDGSTEAYLVEDLKHSAVDPPQYDSPVDEIEQLFDTYSKSIAETLEEIADKSSTARELNLRARALATDKRLGLSAVAKLDHIVVVTASDLLDMEDVTALLHSANRQLPAPYTMAEKFANDGPVMGGRRSDASWVEFETEDEPAPSDRRALLARTAATLVDTYDRERLADDNFVAQVIAYQIEYDPSLKEASNLALFRGVLETARQERLAEKVEKQAAADDSFDFDNFDATELYG